MPAGTLIGLDIGSDSVRAVQTSRTKNGPVVTGFAQVPLAPGTVSAGTVQDDTALTAALRQLWDRARFSTREVVLGVTNPQVVVREMAVANVPERQMRSSLPFQVREMLPLPVERSLLDFYPLERPGSAATVRGMLIAAPKEAVLTAVRAVQRAGLRVSQVDLAAFALLRATSYLDDEIEALLDIGAQTTSVVVHAGGEPLIVRTIPRGGAEITEALVNLRELTPERAETVKRQVGVLLADDPATGEVIRAAVRPLISEVRGSFAYLTAGDRQARVARLALSGGGANLPGLVEYLGEQLDVTAALADPTCRIRGVSATVQDDLSQSRSSAAVSIGLTLGAAR